MSYSLKLDMEQSPRLTRSGAKEIETHKRKQASHIERNQVLQFCFAWGYRDPLVSYQERLRIAKAACKVVAYDCGFKTTLAHTRVAAWYAEWRKMYEDGEDAPNCVAPKHIGSVK